MTLFSDCTIFRIGPQGFPIFCDQECTSYHEFLIEKVLVLFETTEPRWTVDQLLQARFAMHSQETLSRIIARNHVAAMRPAAAQ
jgi:hypothetical protein